LYLESGRNLGISRDAREWVGWMLDVTTEAVRVSRGLVLWVCAGVTRDHCYWPACEGLLWEWWKAGGKCWRPCYWHRVGIPGSGGKRWLRADVEYVLAFKGADNEFWTDNTACGKPPKWNPGGAMSYRSADGSRKNAFGVMTDRPVGSRKTGLKPDSETYRANGKLMTRRDATGARQKGMIQPDGSAEQQFYIPPALANPGTFHEWDFSPDEAAWLEQAYIHTTVGGGQLGSELAHESEAPYPEALVEFFVKSFSLQGGLVLDPFDGSGTSVAVAIKNGRNAIGSDLRRSQASLATRRIADGLRPVSKLDPSKPIRPGAGQGDLFAGLDDES
jgi:hypothetical protein